MDIKTATMSELLAFYNSNSGKAPVKKFADRKTAERRVSVLIGGDAAVIPQTQPAVEASADTPEARLAQAKKKIAAKKKAAKKSASLKVPADRSKAVKESWGKPSVAKARSTHHSVKASGGEYKSVAAAFLALDLPMGRHISFRGKLKKSGREVFEYENKAGEKKAVTFVLVDKE